MADSYECPRCGYDLQGVRAGWQGACPLDGTCSECGLAFTWRDVLNPDYALPPWLVEAKRGVTAWPAQVLGTLLRAFRPRRYWSRLGMHQPVRWRRLVAYACSLLVLLLFVLHVVTAVLYLGEHDAIVARGGGRVTTTATRGSVLVHGLTRPWAGRSRGIYAWTLARGGTMSTPREGPRRWWWWRWGATGAFWLPIAVTPLTVALAFAALPQSRRRAKVRWRHVMRVALHGVVVPFVLLALLAVGSTGVPLGAGRPSTPMLFITGLWPVLTFVWWWAAVRSYLRMPHAPAVALSATAIGLLLPVVIAATVWYSL